VIYSFEERFEIGGSKVVRDGDDVTLVGAGVTLHEALAAAERLAGDFIQARVIDLDSLKPVDTETLARAASETAEIVTAEDHRPEGGLGEAVLAALAAQVPVRTLAVSAMPGSGSPQELLHSAGIDATAIEAAARKLVLAPTHA